MDYSMLVESILSLHRDSVGRAAAAINQALVVRNWMMGAYIVEFEQNGEDRAAYGHGLLRRLSIDLVARGIKGSSPDMLERMRLFFRRYPQLDGYISAPAVRDFKLSRPTPDADAISAPLVRKSVAFPAHAGMNHVGISALRWDRAVRGQCGQRSLSSTAKSCSLIEIDTYADHDL